MSYSSEWHKKKRIIERKNNISNEIVRQVSALNLPNDVINRVEYIMEQIAGKYLKNNHPDKVVISAIIYHTTKTTTPKLLIDIVKVCGYEERTLMRNYRFIIRILGESIEKTNPELFIPEFSKGLGYNEHTKKIAFDILKKVSEKNILIGRRPTHIAGAALYTAGILNNERRRQKDILKLIDNNSSKNSEEPIRYCFHEIQKILLSESNGDKR